MSGTLAQGILPPASRQSEAREEDSAMVSVLHRSSVRCGLGVAVVMAGLLASNTARADKDDLSLLPVDSEVVGGLDFQQLQGSLLWKQFVGPMLAKNNIQSQLT